MIRTKSEADADDEAYDSRLSDMSKMETKFVSRYADSNISELDSSFSFKVQKFPVSLADDFDLSALLLVRYLIF